MKKYMISNNMEINLHKYREATKYDIKNPYKKFKNSLCAAKNKLNNITIYNEISGSMDPFKREKYIISKNINADNVTNAWLKCYEIISKYNLIKKDTRHFDNAALPGSFILATHHYVKTHQEICENYDWWASSLLGENGALGDDYDLYKNYPDKWMMGNNDGDITNFENIEIITRNLLEKTGGKKINLYTSDLGFDIGTQYNKQEILHMRANAGQILMCLNILEEGGNCIIKHYTFFEEFTLSYLTMFCKLFKDAYIYKPLSSKELNSEIYIIGIGFKPDNTDYLRKLLLTGDLQPRLLKPFEITRIKKFTQQFITNTYKKAKKIYEHQIKSINIAVEIDRKIKEENITDIKNFVLNYTKKHRNGTIGNYYKICDLRPINEGDKLIVKTPYK